MPSAADTAEGFLGLVVAHFASIDFVLDTWRPTETSDSSSRLQDADIASSYRVLFVWFLSALTTSIRTANNIK